MAVIEFEEALNVRTIPSYFADVVKSSDYNDDIVVKFPENTHVDLAGLQILLSMKKEVEKNGKSFQVEGLEDTLLEYFGQIVE